MRLQSIRSSVVIAASGIAKSFGTKNVLNDVEFTVGYDSRIVITGPNGSEKSTLLSILVGRETPDSGRVAFAPSVRLGFLPQEPQLDEPGNTVLDHFRRGMVGYEEDFVFDLVTCGLLRYEELDKPAERLSLRQVRKLQIARMIAEEPNVLIMDEPTNHVSLDVLESFEAALVGFQGPILSVSHDIGKVRVPAEILTNPDGLSEAEFSIIKTHPSLGYDILKSIELPWPVAEIVRQHHERIDRSGYPQGLHGESSLMESKILAVADVVEAIASHRPYRPALGIDQALQGILKNSGRLYDADVVDCCLVLLNERAFEFR